MKFKKTTAAILACACAVPMLALTACGDDENDDNPPGVTTYTFEAEGVDLSEQSGRGWSNEATGCQMIMGKNNSTIADNSKVLNSISNGYFVGFFGIQGTVLEFDINADEADADAKLVLRLASEWGTLQVDDSVMTVEVNGTKISYDALDVTGKNIGSATEAEYGVPFKDFTLSSSIALKKGENTVKIIASGKLFNDTSIPCGPGVDCIKIKSKSTLTWESLWEYNKDNVQSY